MNRLPILSSILVVGAMWTSACILPRGGPARNGSGSMDDIRNRLRGDWELASLTTFNGSGTPVRWDTAGQLTYDGFGNWREHLERHEGLRPEVLIDFSGQAVIDPVRHLIQFEDVEQRADSTGTLPPILGPQHLNQYAFTQSDGLTTNVLDENGQVVATLVWRRGQVTAATISGKSQEGVPDV